MPSFRLHYWLLVLIQMSVAACDEVIPEKNRYASACEEAVKLSLKSPSSYESIELDVFTHSEPVVYMRFDASNSFGVPLRRSAMCRFYSDAKESKKLAGMKEFKIGGEQLSRSDLLLMNIALDLDWELGKNTTELQILDWGCRSKNRYMLIEGSVKNITDTAMNGIEAIGKFVDENGNIVRKEEAPILPDPLEPNEIGKFSIREYRDDSFTACRVEFAYSSGSVIETETAKNPPRPETNIEEAQRLLALLGYKIGRIDGIYGSRTRAAIEQFQRDQGLSVTGLISDELLESLRTKKEGQ